MPDTSLGGQSPGAPELVEILKQLGAHRQKVWDRTYGDELPDNLNKIGGEFREALGAEDRNAARDLLCRFVAAANVECSEDSRRQMLANLDSIMESRRAALASGDTKFDAMPAELGPEAERAFDLWIWIRNQRYTPEESAAYWRHPLRWLCRRLEEILGIPRQDLETAAYRLNSELGLREMAPLRAPDGTVGHEGQLDWLWMPPKFRELDRDGTTARLWQTLLHDSLDVLVDAGLAPATSTTPPARRDGARRRERRAIAAGEGHAAQGSGGRGRGPEQAPLGRRRSGDSGLTGETGGPSRHSNGRPKETRGTPKPAKIMARRQSRRRLDRGSGP